MSLLGGNRTLARLLFGVAALFGFCGDAGAQTPVAGKPLAEQVETCAACHGAGGISTTPDVPSLAGQPPLYAVNQLILFRETLRKSDLMTPVAKGLQDEEIIKLADYFAKLPLTSTADATPPDPARMQRGAELAKVHRCDNCHLPSFAGREQIPRISGQREDYLALALRQYRDSQRVGSDTTMIAAMYGISDADIATLAYFLARVQGSPPTR